MTLRKSAEPCRLHAVGSFSIFTTACNAIRTHPARFCKVRLYQCFRVTNVSKHPQEQLQKTSHPSLQTKNASL